MTFSEKQLAEGILFTDQYQLTMAHLYYRENMHEVPARFEHFFRSYPEYDSHAAGYCISAGLEDFLDWLEEAYWTDADIRALEGLTGPNGERLFGDDFLQWLRNNPPKTRITIRSVPEGRVIHPLAPITIIEGPLALLQLLETSLLNHVNYPVLVATKASRLRECAPTQPVLEFGLRRAQGRAATSGARAALIGGANFTSNVGASCALGYPPKGTHAHSMVQAFMAQGRTELDAFRAYAETYPDNCLLLVDTIHTLESGVPNAIQIFKELEQRGYTPRGIRIDSGDLAYLGVQAAKMLNDAGFSDCRIVLSGDLDELAIKQILEQIAKEAPSYGVDPQQLANRLIFGVGTRLITSQGAGSLDGIYKLVSLKAGNEWKPALKLSESPEKRLTPGAKNVWRVIDERGKATADLLTLHDEMPNATEPLWLYHPSDSESFRRLSPARIQKIEPLLELVYKEGERQIPQRTLEDARKQRKADTEQLDPGVRRIIHPHVYHVSLSHKLWRLKQELTQSTEEAVL